MQELSFADLVQSHHAKPKTRKLSDYDRYINHCKDSYNKRTLRFNRNLAVITPRERKYLSAFRDFCIDEGCTDHEQIQLAFDKVLSAMLNEGWVARLNPLKFSDLLANDKLIGRFNLDWFKLITRDNESEDVVVEEIQETNNIDVVYREAWLAQVIKFDSPKVIRLVGGKTLSAYPSDLSPITDSSIYEQAADDEGFRHTKAYLAYLHSHEQG